MTAEQFRRAADRIDELAEKATPGPWAPVENYPDAYVVCALGGFYVATENHEGDVREGDARWIAMLGPQIAAPLASWLRAEADQLDSAGWEPWEEATEYDYPPTALARLILGETK